jgi:carbonic anhydrase/acetyltransferase-like protein (isoleucine patch superfamily)
MTIYTLGEKAPQFADRGSSWIAPDARLIGDIQLGRNTTIWFGVVIRGDNDTIVIGDDTNIQEHVVMHTDPGIPLTVGRSCTIGHRAVLHGCMIGDNSLIGIGAIILNGAKIGMNCLVGAGSLVTEGKEFPDNSLIVGSPARVKRSLEGAEIEALSEAASHYVKNGARFRSSLSET